MAVYMVANYTITNPDGYGDYPMQAGPTVFAHGGELLAADFESDMVEGKAGPATVVLKFPSRKAFDGWYNSAEYQAVIGMRTGNSTGFVAIANEFEMPE